MRGHCKRRDNSEISALTFLKQQANEENNLNRSEDDLKLELLMKFTKFLEKETFGKHRHRKHGSYGHHGRFGHFGLRKHGPGFHGHGFGKHCPKQHKCPEKVGRAIREQMCGGRSCTGVNNAASNKCSHGPEFHNNDNHGKIRAYEAIWKLMCRNCNASCVNEVEINNDDHCHGRRGIHDIFCHGKRGHHRKSKGGHPIGRQICRASSEGNEGRLFGRCSSHRHCDRNMCKASTSNKVNTCCQTDNNTPPVDNETVNEAANIDIDTDNNENE